MNNIIKTARFPVTIGILFFFFSSCHKTKLSRPKLDVLTVSGLTASSVNYNSAVLDNGGEVLSKTGICWSTKPEPTEDLTSVALTANAATSITGKLTALDGGTVYYIRAFATNGAGTTYSNELTVTTLLEPGQYFGGGIVFSVDATGRKGLMVSSEDLATSVQWANTLTPVLIGASSDSDGKANTDKIISTYGAGNYAAQLCRNYRSGGFTDWYLPSLAQLRLLAAQKKFVGGLDNYYYWSSTENSTIDAWQILPINGASNNGGKVSNAAVRAIRSF